jgi:cysteine desulfurase family protein
VKKVYMDNGATTFPKPKSVIDTIVDFMTNIGCSPGRGGYDQSLKAGRIVYETRDMLNSFFNGPGVDNVIFTQNVTTSLNIAIKGMFKPGWHVLTTSIEHNSVMRPLRRLEKESGISFTIVDCNKDGSMNLEKFKNSITRDTKAVVMTHASNLVGTIMPVEEIGMLCKEYGLYFILDTAQTAGIIDIDFKRLNLDVLAFTGHKGLLGPQGIGGFLISDRANIITQSLIDGGTGSKSHMDIQPEILPDKFESGTLNIVGIAGLKAGVEFIQHEGISSIRQHEARLTDMLINGLLSISGIEIYGLKDSSRQISTVSINIKDMDPSEVSYILDSEFGIMTRSGMHCTPYCHKTINTFPKGTVRFSIGYFNTKDDIDYTLDAIKKIANYH